jgi:hypothetical protein
MYEEELGRPLPVSLLSRRSSHVNMPAELLRPKLQLLVQEFGRDKLHTMLHKSAHILSSKPKRLHDNIRWLQHRLQLSDQRFHRVVALAPR